MNAQDIRNLQEAYLEVVENKQLDEEEQSSMPPRRSAAQRKKRAKELGDRQTIRGIVTAHNKKRQPSRQEDPEKYYPKEQYDLYDIILSHLLDEGYAETPEAAEAIMVNMGEEWREDIVEGAAGDVAARAQKLANQKKGQTPERKKMYQDLAYKARSRERDGSGSPRTSRFERSKAHGPDITPMMSQSRSSQETLGGGTYEPGPKRKPKGKKYKRQVQSGVRAASSQEKERLGIKEDR